MNNLVEECDHEITNEKRNDNLFSIDRILLRENSDHKTEVSEYESTEQKLVKPFPIKKFITESHYFLRNMSIVNTMDPLMPNASTVSSFQNLYGYGSNILSIESSKESSDNQRRKRSWSRAVFSNLQRKGLEKRFAIEKYITKPNRRKLANQLGLTDAQVKVWFQNRRMKWRHKHVAKNKSSVRPTDEYVAGTNAEEDEEINVVD